MDLVENDWHLFFQCTTSILCWDFVDLRSVVVDRSLCFSSAAAVLFDVCSREEESITVHVFMLIWAIWQNRNDSVWNQHRSNAEQICNRVQYV